MKSCTIITCNNCEFYNTQYCKNCSKEGDDCYEHWEWRHDISWRQEQIDNLTQKISDIEAKLAEKDEMIEKLKDESVKYYCAAFNYKEHLKQAEQDKISFTVEKLEKVKEFLINSVAWWGYKCGGVSPTEFIDNQIKQLKEMK